MFLNRYVLACSTSRGSAGELNEMAGYGTVPQLTKMTEHSSTWNSIELNWRHQIDRNGSGKEQAFNFQLTL